MRELWWRIERSKQEKEGGFGDVVYKKKNQKIQQLSENNKLEKWIRRDPNKRTKTTLYWFKV